jgi:hypothetical protein
MLIFEEVHEAPTEIPTLISIEEVGSKIILIADQ